MVEGGATPLATATELEAMGFSLVIFPGGIVRLLARAAEGYYANLLASGSNEQLSEAMHDFNSLNALIGTPDMLALGERYGGGRDDA